MGLETISEQACFDGVQGFYKHASRETGTEMRFALYQPPQAKSGKVPIVVYLAGLTCTEETATIKAGAQRLAAEAGLMLVMPDTSPRGAGIAGEDDDWDFGTAAGFYIDATAEPWSKNYRMYSYITSELPEFVFGGFPADPAAQGIMGHSMGGHGALTIALKNPTVFKSVSAFAPICNPTNCPWGEKAFSNYLGGDRSAWSAHDATELVLSGQTHSDKILIDQGSHDQFLEVQLHPEAFVQACADKGQHVDLRMQPGYDHSYYFIQTFMPDHIAHHARALKG